MVLTRVISVASGAFGLFFLVSFWLAAWRFVSSADTNLGYFFLAAFGLAYLVSLYRHMFSGLRPASAGADPALDQFAREVESACREAGLPPVPTFVRHSPQPNLVLFGLGFFANRLIVTDSLIKSQARQEIPIKPVIAHELGHLASWDVPFFTLGYGPHLWIKTAVRVLLWIPALLLRFIGPVIQGGLMGSMFFVRSCTGCFVVLFLFGLLIFTILFLGQHILMLVFWLLLSILPFCGFLRNREYVADAIGIMWLKRPQPLAIALAKSIQANPQESMLVASVFTEAEPSSRLYAPKLIQAVCAAGFPLTLGKRFILLFRSHPYAVQRLAKIAKRYAAQFA